MPVSAAHVSMRIQAYVLPLRWSLQRAKLVSGVSSIFSIHSALFGAPRAAFCKYLAKLIAATRTRTDEPNHESCEFCLAIMYVAPRQELVFSGPSSS